MADPIELLKRVAQENGLKADPNDYLKRNQGNYTEALRSMLADNDLALDDEEAAHKMFGLPVLSQTYIDENWKTDKEVDELSSRSNDLFDKISKVKKGELQLSDIANIPESEIDEPSKKRLFDNALNDYTKELTKINDTIAKNEELRSFGFNKVEKPPLGQRALSEVKRTIKELKSHDPYKLQSSFLPQNITPASKSLDDAANEAAKLEANLSEEAMKKPVVVSGGTALKNGAAQAGPGKNGWTAALGIMNEADATLSRQLEMAAAEVEKDPTNEEKIARLQSIAEHLEEQRNQFARQFGGEVAVKQEADKYRKKIKEETEGMNSWMSKAGINLAQDVSATWYRMGSGIDDILSPLRDESLDDYLKRRERQGKKMSQFQNVPGFEGQPMQRYVDVEDKRFVVDQFGDIMYPVDKNMTPLKETFDKEAKEYEANRDKYESKIDFSIARLGGATSKVMVDMLPIILTNMAVSSIPGVGQVKAVQNLAGYAATMLTMFQPNFEAAIQAGGSFDKAWNTAMITTIPQAFMEYVFGVEQRAGRVLSDAARRSITTKLENLVQKHVTSGTPRTFVDDLMRNYPRELAEEFGTEKGQDIYGAYVNYIRNGIVTETDPLDDVNLLLSLKFSVGSFSAISSYVKTSGDKRSWKESMIAATMASDRSREFMQNAVDGGAMTKEEMDARLGVITENEAIVDDIRQNDRLSQDAKNKVFDMVAERALAKARANGAKNNTDRDKYQKQADAITDDSIRELAKSLEGGKSNEAESPFNVPVTEEELNKADGTTTPQDTGTPQADTAGEESQTAEPTEVQAPPTDTGTEQPRAEGAATVLKPQADEVTQERSPVAEAEATPQEVVPYTPRVSFYDVMGENKVVTKEGREGVIKVDDGGKVTFESDGTIEEVGNIDDLQGESLSDYGFSAKDVAAVTNRTYKVGEDTYISDNLDGAVERDADGNLTVTLMPIKGGKVAEAIVFRGQQAENLAYQIRLDQFSNLQSNEGVRTFEAVVAEGGSASEQNAPVTEDTGDGGNAKAPEGQTAVLGKSEYKKVGDVWSDAKGKKVSDKGKIAALERKILPDAEATLSGKNYTRFEGDWYTDKDKKVNMPLSISKLDKKALEPQKEAIRQEPEAKTAPIAPETPAVRQEAAKEAPPATITTIKDSEGEAMSPDDFDVKDMNGVPYVKHDLGKRFKGEKGFKGVRPSESLFLNQGEKYGRVNFIADEDFMAAFQYGSWLSDVNREEKGRKNNINPDFANKAARKYGLGNAYALYQSVKEIAKQERSANTDVVIDFRNQTVNEVNAAKEAPQEPTTAPKAEPKPQAKPVAKVAQKATEVAQTAPERVQKSQNAETNTQKGIETPKTAEAPKTVPEKTQKEEPKKEPTKKTGDLQVNDVVLYDGEPYRIYKVNSKNSFDLSNGQGGWVLDASPKDKEWGGATDIKLSVPQREPMPIDRETYNSLLEQLDESIKGVLGGVLSGKEFASELKEQSGREIRNAKGTVYGFVGMDGKVYLNGEKINANTPIHEYGHVWINAIKKARPDIYNKGLEIADKTKYVAELLKNPAYKDAATAYRKGNKTALLEEALAMAIGDRGEMIVNSANKKRFKEWLRDFWNSVKEFFGGKLTDLTPEQVQNLKPLEFIELAAGQLVGGERVFDGGTSSDAQLQSKESHIQVGDRNISLTKLKEYGEAVLSERLLLQRLSPQDERGRIEGGRRTVEATILVAAVQGSSGKVEGSSGGGGPYVKRKEQAALEQYAKSEGIWVDNVDSKFGKPHEKGTENKVYLDPSGSFVTKINDGSYYKSWYDVFDRIAVHNRIAPYAKYEVVGFGKTEDGDFRAILRQPNIRGVPADRGAINAHMSALGYNIKPGGSLANPTYVNDQGVIVWDLHLGNVVANDAGEIRIIDPLIDVKEQYKFGEIDLSPLDEADGTNTTFDPNTNDIRFQIIGEQGAQNILRAKKNIDIARQLEQEGKSPEKIWLATGWERGGDGLWRYEVPDIEVDVEGKIRDKVYSLADVASADFINAYPALKNTKIKFTTKQNDEESAFTFKDKEGVYTITVFVDGSTEWRDRSNIGEYQRHIAHEIQHVIQREEGFPVGGSPGSIYEKDVRDVYEKEYQNILDYIAADGRFDPNRPNAIIYDSLVQQYMSENHPDLYRDALDKYRKLSGEVEARNVETRMGMKGRNKVPLSATEDVARESQIYLKPDGPLKEQRIEERQSSADARVERARLGLIEAYGEWIAPGAVSDPLKNWDSTRKLIGRLLEYAIARGIQTKEQLVALVKNEIDAIADKSGMAQYKKIEEYIVKAVLRGVRAYDKADSDVLNLTGQLADLSTDIYSAPEHLYRLYDDAGSTERQGQIKKFIDVMLTQRQEYEEHLTASPTDGLADFEKKLREELNLYTDPDLKYGYRDQTNWAVFGDEQATEPAAKPSTEASIEYAFQMLSAWHAEYKKHGENSTDFVRLVADWLRVDGRGHIGAGSIRAGLQFFVNHMRENKHPNTPLSVFAKMEKIITEESGAPDWASLMGAAFRSLQRKYVDRYNTRYFSEAIKATDDFVSAMHNIDTTEYASDADNHDKILQEAEKMRGKGERRAEAKAKPRHKHQARQTVAKRSKNEMQERINRIKEALKNC